MAMREVRKAFAYVTHGDNLLVFDHLNSAEAGTQVPAGTVCEGETPAAAALREAHEESGLTGLRLVRGLGEKMHPVPERGEVHRRHFYHLECVDIPPEHWRHYETDPSDGTTEPILFAFYWVDLRAQLPVLAPGHDAFLDTVRRAILF